MSKKAVAPRITFQDKLTGSLRVSIHDVDGVADIEGSDKRVSWYISQAEKKLTGKRIRDVESTFEIVWFCSFLGVLTVKRKRSKVNSACRASK